jgi:hypothetical protein
MTAVLDDILPTHRHRERHATQIAAAPEAVWGALHAVSAGDLRLTRLLTTIRALPARLPGRRMPGGGLPADRGFIEAFMERGYRELRVDPPSTLVAGAAGQPWRLRGGETADVVDLDGLRAFARPGFVLIATSFELEGVGDRTRLSTETRVKPTDAAAARAFRPYWWAIRAGSGLIRRDVLRAVRRRAERDATPTEVATQYLWSQPPHKGGNRQPRSLDGFHIRAASFQRVRAAYVRSSARAPQHRARTQASVGGGRRARPACWRARSSWFAVAAWTWTRTRSAQARDRCASAPGSRLAGRPAVVALRRVMPRDR